MGIKNGGATCYMNSLFQQLFMQPSIRHYLLAAPEVDEDQRADSVFYQLQVRGSDVSHLSAHKSALCDQHFLVQAHKLRRVRRLTNPT